MRCVIVITALMALAGEAQAWEVKCVKRAPYAASKSEQPCETAEEFRTGFWIGEHYALCKEALAETGLQDHFVERQPFYRPDGLIAFIGDPEIVPPAPGPLGSPSLLGALYGKVIADSAKTLAAASPANDDEAGRILMASMMVGLMMKEPVEQQAAAWAQDRFKFLVDYPYLRSMCEFAELPDFFFSINDYYSEGHAPCPAGLDPANCHAFSELSLLNSTHFGDQARRMYLAYHSLAVNIARGCVEETERSYAELGVTPFPEWIKLPHRWGVSSCDALALMYEGVALHYLQDRWSSGHMWQRWGAPTMQMYGGQGKSLAQEVALVSGLQHGADAVLHQLSRDTRDAMCAPDGRYRWGVADSSERWEAVGDTYIKSLFNEARYATQRDWLIKCSVASIEEVYRAGSGSALGDIARSEVFDTEHCLGPYATNASMAHGFGISGLEGDDEQIAIHEVAKFGWAWGPTLGLSAGFVDGYTNLGFQLAAAAMAAPDGLDLAQGTTMPDFLGIKPGNAYANLLPAAYHDQQIPIADASVATGASSRDGSNSYSYVLNQHWYQFPREKCWAHTAEVIDALRTQCTAEHPAGVLDSMGFAMANPHHACTRCGNAVLGRIGWKGHEFHNEAQCTDKWGVPALETRTARCTLARPPCQNDPGLCGEVLLFEHAYYCSGEPLNETLTRALMCPL